MEQRDSESGDATMQIGRPWSTSWLVLDAVIDVVERDEGLCDDGRVGKSKVDLLSGEDKAPRSPPRLALCLP